MVQVMESWFLADTATRSSPFTAKEFQELVASTEPETIEEIPKQDVERGLNRQRVSHKAKGRYYDKGKHSFAILAELESSKGSMQVALRGSLSHVSLSGEAWSS